MMHCQQPVRAGYRSFVAAVAGMALLIGLLPAHADNAAVESRLLNDVKYLASDELEGRGIGTEGLNKAAAFVRKQFAAAGLDVSRVDGGAFQSFEMVTGSELGSPNTLELAGPEGKRIELNIDADFQTCSFGGSGAFEAPLVFLGYGIDDADKNYNDFENVDVEGKVVMIMRRVPQQSNPHGPFSGPHGSVSRHGDLRYKVSNAFGKGAAAILFVNDPHSSRNNAEKRGEQIAKLEQRVVEAALAFDAAERDGAENMPAARKKLGDSIEQLKSARRAAEAADNDALMAFGYAGHGEGRTIPVLHIRQEAANEVLKAGLGKTLEQLEAEVDAELKPQSAEIKGWTARGETSVKQIKAEVKNVIGVLEGSGPLADETIVVGAHYDHVGMGGEGSLAPGSMEVHNGADDNASGTAALIELARRLAARQEKLPRRIVFIAFTAEEVGLVGSARYVKEPTIPLEKTIAMFNMDMVGRMVDDKLTVFGTGTAEHFRDLVERHGKEHGLELTLKPEGFGPSDHSSFYAKKIPVLHLFTGSHRDYHRPTDTWEKINAAGMARVVDLLEQITLETAKSSQRPEYREVESRATLQRGGNRPYFGSIPDFGGEAQGYAISGTAPGSPAAKGGLKAGDVIVRFGGNRIGALDDFDLALRKFSAGDEVKVVVLREGKEQTLTVVLDQPR
jgi:hypothetical protein